MSKFIITFFISSAALSLLALIYMAVTPSLVKKYSTKWIYYGWLIIVIGLIIPFRPSLENAVIQIEIPQTIYSGAQTDMQSVTQQTGQPGTSPGGSDFTARENNITEVNLADRETKSGNPFVGISWSMILIAVWLCGTAVILICHIIRHMRFIRSIWRWGEEVTDNRTLGIWKNVRKEMKITDQIGLQRSELTGSPVLTGISYPRIMLPKTDIPDYEMALILKHELVHYKRKDLWYKSLILLAVAIHWFNPVVYVMAKKICLLCERSCDDEVIKYKDADSRYEYSAAIIHSIRYADSTTALSTNFFGGKKEMKNRISSIMDTKRKRRGSIIICAAIIITLVTGLAFAVGTGEPVELVGDGEGNEVAGAPESGDTGVPESESIFGEWIMIENTLSTEKDGPETPEGNTQPVIQSIYIYEDNTFRHIFHNHGTIEGAIRQTGENEYIITTRVVMTEIGTQEQRDDEQWLRYYPESGLLRFTLYSAEDNIYAHTYFERADTSIGDPIPGGVYTALQIQAAVAGNWRSQRFDGYTANDMIISLYADGSWKWSGPLATDNVDGGRYTVTRVCLQIYFSSDDMIWISTRS